MNQEEIAARMEIQHLISTYTASADRGDFDRMAWIWADDAVVLPPGGARIEGRENIMARFRGLGLRPRARAAAAAEAEAAEKAGDTSHRKRPDLTFVQHHITTCHIELDGEDRASGLTYWINITDAGIDHVGAYTDKFKRVNGQWLFAERKTRISHIPDSTLLGLVLRDAMMADKKESQPEQS